MNIRDLVPPLFLRAIQKLKRNDICHQTYSSFDQANAACKGMGYEDKELIEVVFEKTKALQEKLDNLKMQYVEGPVLQFLSSLAFVKKSVEKPICILDFGGACGAHFFSIKASLKTNFKMKYVVVETPSMVNKAKELQNDEILFLPTIEEAMRLFPKFDLVYTSGAIQCVPDSLMFLKKLIEVNADYILFTRCSFSTTDQDIFFVQESDLAANGPGDLPPKFKNKKCKYPVTYISEKKFFAILNSSYEPILQFPEKSGMINIVEKLTGFGLLAKRKV